EAGAKFSDYFEFGETLTKLPSHRILALFRGEKEEVLDLTIEPEGSATTQTSDSPYELRIMHRFAIADRGRPGDRWLIETARCAWRTKIFVHLSVDLRLRLWNAAEQEAVRVFAANLRALLLAAPACPCRKFKFEHTDGVARPKPALQAHGLLPSPRAALVRPSTTRGACEPHCSIADMPRADGADAAH